MVSKRLTTVPSSPIRKLVPFAQAAKKEGVHVYHLNIGDPDIKTPDVMLNVLTNWKDNPLRYGQTQGEVKFLEALKIYYHRLGFDFIDTTHIQVTSGGSEAISMAMFATTEIGDEVLTFEPLYTNYNSYAAINGVTLKAILTTADTGFHLPSKKDIENAITEKTKAILLCNPNNPTGTVYTKEEIETLITLAKKHNLFILSDEVYREYTYDGRVHVSLLSYMRDLPEQIIVLDSMSKRYSLCGVRLGNLVTLNKAVLAGVLAIAQGRLSAGFVDQEIAAKLVDVPQKYLDDVHAEYVKRRDVLYEGLKSIEGVVIPKPEGAFYTIVGLPVDDAEKFCQWLLTDFRHNNETLMLAPAAGFYATKGKGINQVRIAYVLNIEAISRCVELLAKALKAYEKK